MKVSLNALIYNLFIDPLLSGLREAVYEKVVQPVLPYNHPSSDTRVKTVAAL